MSNKTVNTTIEILGKCYPIRCPELELPALQAAASYLNEKMLETQNTSTVVAVDRLALITALNIANQFLQSEQQKSNYMNDITQRISDLQDKLEDAVCTVCNAN